VPELSTRARFAGIADVIGRGVRARSRTPRRGRVTFNRRIDMNAASHLRGVLVVYAGVALASAAPLHAQATSAGASDTVLTGEDIQARRTEIAMEALALPDAQREKLMPIYTRYRDDALKQNTRYAKVIKAFYQSSGEVSDAQAESLASGLLQYQTDRVSLQRKYLPRFTSVLAGVKALRLIQIENKLDAMVMYGLADNVPLARERQ
jgi:Spy/CpxP family protein refolding chaperone